MLNDPFVSRALRADVSPPPTQLTRKYCKGEARGCSGGDAACRKRAEDDGYTVSIGNYQLCRPADVATEPTVSAAVILVVGTLMAIGIFVVVRKRRARRVL